MSGISSGIGLISGINSVELINQLMSIERRPIENLTGRIAAIDAQRTAIQALTARLLAVQNSVSRFDNRDFLNRFTSVSSNEQVATATASANAISGTTSFRVYSLVTNSSVVSRGFADSDVTPIGLGTLSIEVGQGKVNRSTALNALNGGQGIGRGVINITDRAGGTAKIDLTGAVTVTDVIDAINANADIAIRARVTSLAANGATGDRIVIEDTSGGTNRLIVADQQGGKTAADLGIAANVAASRIDGSDLVRLSKSTQLSTLNDGNGVGVLPQGSNADDLIFSSAGQTFGVSLSSILATQLDVRLDALNSGNGVRLGVIRITDRSGQSVDIDLADQTQPPLRTIRDIRQRITDATAAAGVKISIAPIDSHFQVTDTSNVIDELAGSFVIEDLSGFAALDLGIADSVEGTGIIGKDIYRVDTIGDAINAINFAKGNNFIEASISTDGNSITIRNLLLGEDVAITAGEGSTAAKDLGLLDVTVSGSGGTFGTRQLLAGLDTVLLRSLNGGQGIGLGEVSLTDRSGQSSVIDLSGAQTLQDVVDLINADASTSLEAAVNDSGNGLVLVDSAFGTGNTVIEDVSGTASQDLGIAGRFTASDQATTVDSGSLQLQYITENTSLDQFNNGAGVALGSIRITDGTGFVHPVDLPRNLSTLGQVADFINLRTNGAIDARINDNGDGLFIEDKTGGDGLLVIEDDTGSTAATDLNIAGTAKTTETFIDGSLEIQIEVGARDTLSDVVAKLNAKNSRVSASIVNAGGSDNPFSLILSSTQSGKKGELIIDSGGLGLGLDTVTKAQDAVIAVGGQGATNPVLITSSSNTIENILPGVSVDLLSPSDEEVTITVDRDIAGITDSVATFVSAFNDVQDNIDSATDFDSETFERAPLFADSAVNTVRTRLQRLMLQRFAELDGPEGRLFSVGIRIGANSRLEFNEQKFSDALEESPEDVKRLFTDKENGFGKVIKDALQGLTRDGDGVLPTRNDLFSDRRQLIQDRIDRLNVLLAAKQTRLERQFAGLETSLANLQGAQNSLTTLGQLAGG